jgi:hypothetical protein
MTTPNRSHAKHFDATARLFAALLFIHSSAPFAGETDSPSKPPDKTIVATKTEINPLCFGNGMLCFDVQDRLRFEGRENTFDFNDSVDALTDDSFLLQRFRIGAAFKPVCGRLQSLFCRRLSQSHRPE